MSAHRARPLPEDWMHRPYVAPQGRREQGWQVRSCAPEMAVYDPTDDDDRAAAQREALTPAEAWLLMVIWLLSCIGGVSVLCAIADAIRSRL